MAAPGVTRVVRWLFPQDRVRTVLLGPIRGTRFKVAPQSGMGATYALGLEAYHQRWFRRHVQRGMTVYDIGANRGQLTLYFASFVGAKGRVIAFEPVCFVYDDLAFNVRLNRLIQVETVCAALGLRRGQEAFSFDKNHPARGKLRHCEPTYLCPDYHTLAVDVISLDEFQEHRAQPPDLLKIDVEGGAGQVLRGATKMLERFSPNVYIELHGPEEQWAVKECLVDCGYRAVTLTGEPVPDPTADWHSPLFCTRSGCSR
jgi:FkbM family methyltransferase